MFSAIGTLLKTVKSEIDQPPESVHITGGMSRAPYDDALLGVVSELAIAAATEPVKSRQASEPLPIAIKDS